MDKVFTIDGAIGFGWTKFKEQYKFFLLFTLAVLILQGVNGFIQGMFENTEPAVAIAIVSVIISFIIGIVIGLFQIRVALDVADGKQATFDSIQRVLPVLGKAVLTHILYSIIVIIGIFLFIVPGIIWAIKYQYALYFVVDKGISPFEALEASGKATQGEKWHLFLFNLVLGLIIFAGLLALGVGLFIAIPITLIAPGFVFRRLQNRGATPVDPMVTPPTPSTPEAAV